MLLRSAFPFIERECETELLVNSAKCEDFGTITPFPVRTNAHRKGFSAAMATALGGKTVAAFIGGGNDPFADSWVVARSAAAPNRLFITFIQSKRTIVLGNLNEDKVRAEYEKVSWVQDDHILIMITDGTCALQLCRHSPSVIVDLCFRC
jgi:hypothetical protein